MKLRKMMVGAMAAVALSGGGVAAMATSAHAAASDAVLLTTTDPLPVHRAGTTCAKATAFGDDVLAKTKWNTVIACHPYITRRGRVAYHWTYIRVDPTTGDLYTSDGWVYPGGAPTSF